MGEDYTNPETITLNTVAPHCRQTHDNNCLPCINTRENIPRVRESILIRERADYDIKSAKIYNHY